jgi:phosphate acetyltransferase
MDLKKRILGNAKKHFKRIVLPESLEERNLKAADRLISEKIAQVILIGNPSEIKTASSKLGLTNIEKAVIVDPSNYDKLESYADTMVELRKAKGLTKEKALEFLKDPLYLATLMIKCGDADGEVAQFMQPAMC